MFPSPRAQPARAARAGAGVHFRPSPAQGPANVPSGKVSSALPLSPPFADESTALDPLLCREGGVRELLDVAARAAGAQEHVAKQTFRLLTAVVPIPRPRLIRQLQHPRVQPLRPVRPSGQPNRPRSLPRRPPGLSPSRST